MDEYGLDDATVNVNAVLCVAAYTGLDMEDALILNKSAVQRGMFSVYQTLCKELLADKGYFPKEHEEDVTVTHVFHNLKKNGQRVVPTLSISGLPLIRKSREDVLRDPIKHHGVHSHYESTPLYVIALKKKYKDGTVEYSDHKTMMWDSLGKDEPGWVHSVCPTAFDGPDPTKALVFIRLRRDPVIGDKFCSRHGQKGTVGLLMPQINLPFSSNGVVPDVIINPHAFPSRMAVGMILELMCGKYAAQEGVLMDGSAWTTVDDKPVSAKLIGELLLGKGFTPYGGETLYNGTSGEAMDVDIFMGVGGYQRLRHMVKDKWQVRARTDHSRTRVVSSTGQPVHGRKLHGGVRVGEMERDALISHGASEIVIDRLLNVSDKTRAYLCASCGGMLCIVEKSVTGLGTWKVCTFCGAGDMSEDGVRIEDASVIRLIDIPQVLRFMIAEMAGLGIRTCLKMEKPRATD
jgi:DNA-directed RNA polymerase I subunit RPA2